MPSRISLFPGETLKVVTGENRVIVHRICFHFVSDDASPNTMCPVLPISSLYGPVLSYTVVVTQKGKMSYTPILCTTSFRILHLAFLIWSMFPEENENEKKK